jgi:hypothetical protein
MTLRQIIFSHAISKVTMIGAVAASTISYAAAGDLPKEGTFTLTSYYNDVWDAIETTPKHYTWTWETTGMHTNDAGSGFGHKVAFHCIGSGGNTNAEGGLRNTGYCVHVDADGDRYETQVEDWQSRSGEPKLGEYTFVDGTGKYAGIHGKATLTFDPESGDCLHFIKPSSHGSGLCINHAKGSYRLTGATP